MRPFHGQNSDQSVERYFDLIDQAAKLSNWTDEHKRGVALLFLWGDVQQYYEGAEKLHNASYDVTKEFIQCFRVKDTAVYKAQQLYNCEQLPGESVQQYACRLKVAGLRTFVSTPREAENLVRRQVLEEQMLAQHVKGLRGELKRFVLHAKPDTFKAAVAVAEEEGKYECLMQDKRHTLAAVQLIALPFLPVAQEVGVTCTSCCGTGRSAGYTAPLSGNGQAKEPFRCFNCGKL